MPSALSMKFPICTSLLIQIHFKAILLLTRGDNYFIFIIDSTHAEVAAERGEENKVP
jgi:hypothetical protein